MTAASTEIKNIVLIDDDQDEFHIFKTAIEDVNEDIQAHHVDNFFKDPGPENCLDPDLVFLDLNMPGINGFEWLQQLRNSRHKDLPIIVYSTSAAPKMVDKAYLLGADLYCVKCSSYQELKKTIGAIISLNWAKREQIKELFRSGLGYEPFSLKPFSM